MLKRLAILAVFGTLLLLWGKEPTKDQQPNTKIANSAPAQHQNVIPPTSAAANPPIASQHAQPEPPNYQHAPNEGALVWFLRPDWVIVWVTVAYVLISGLTLLAIKQQADTMREQAKDARTSAADAAATSQSTLAAIKAQVGVMERQANLMQANESHTDALAQQAIRQANLTQSQLDLANRPWLAIDSVTPVSNLQFREDGCVEIRFRYQIRNVGHSVAQHVLPWIEPIITGVDDPAEVRSRISEQLRKPVDSPFDHGKLIFPTQAIIDNYPILIPPEKLAKALDNSPFKGPDQSAIRGIGLEVFVCFDYQSTLDTSKHHQTQSMYLVSHGGRGLFLPSQKSYSADGLSLIFKGFGAYAD